MGKQQNIVTVEAGQYVPLKGNKFVVIGPGEVKVTRWDNGNVDVEVTKGKSSPVRDAMRRKLVRVGWGI